MSDVFCFLPRAWLESERSGPYPDIESKFLLDRDLVVVSVSFLSVSGSRLDGRGGRVVWWCQFSVASIVGACGQGMRRLLVGYDRTDDLDGKGRLPWGYGYRHRRGTRSKADGVMDVMGWGWMGVDLGEVCTDVITANDLD